MLKRFEVQNFKGFKDPIVFDFKAKEYAFNPNIVRNGLVKNALIYGKNGTGKSSIGFALFDIVSHLTEKVFFPAEITHNYVNLDSEQVVATFRYTFDFDGTQVDYHYSKTSVGDLCQETLIIDGKTVIDYDFTSADREKHRVDADTFPIRNIDLPDNHLSVLKYLYRNLPSDAVPVLTKLFKFCENMLWYRSLSNGNSFVGFKTYSEKLAKVIHDTKSLDRFTEFLRENDLYYDLEFEFYEGQPVLVAKFKNGRKAPFETIASTGTNALFLFFAWSLRLEEVSFLFIDEFDAFLHFEAARAIVKRLNAIACQTVLTSHNTYLMCNELTRPDCCFLLADKQLRPLCNCTEKEIREAHNLEKMYVHGVFNA